MPDPNQRQEPSIGDMVRNRLNEEPDPSSGPEVFGESDVAAIKEKMDKRESSRSTEEHAEKMAEIQGEIDRSRRDDQKPHEPTELDVAVDKDEPVTLEEKIDTAMDSYHRTLSMVKSAQRVHDKAKADHAKATSELVGLLKQVQYE